MASISLDQPRIVSLTDSRPTVSVIIPTFNRASTLADTLASLMTQEYPTGCLEILIVDNASTDETAAVVARFQAERRRPIHYWRIPNRGPAAARNHAIARSTGTILAFTDSDCTLPPSWVAAGVAALMTRADVVTGPVRPVINPRRIPSFFYHQTDHRRPNELFPTANVFYRREVIDQLGGFNERFGAYRWGPPVGGEDIDLAWRAREAGYRLAWSETAAVDHQASTIPWKVWLLEPVKAQIMPSMVAAYPGLRASLYWRYFTGRENPFFYLGLIGLLMALSGRQRAGLALVAPWLWIMRPMIERDLGDPRRWWRIPLKYLLMSERFGLLGLTLIAASLRSRTVVL